jgi:lipopolysaccharide biosynthesis glycosyltransferase
MDHPSAKSQPEVTLLCCGDEKYAMPLTVMVCSAAVNLAPNWRLGVYLMEGGILPETRKHMEKKLGAFANVDLHWHTIDLEHFRDLPVLRRINSTMYIRLLMDDILPADLERLVYLDGDMLVESDLSQLYREDFAGATLMAVCDYGSSILRPELPVPGADAQQRKSAPYFNSGVLLINMKPWRDQRIGREVLDYVSKHKSEVRFPDQDWLNAVLFGKWKQLDLAWNAQVDNLINTTQLGKTAVDEEVRRRRDELLYHPKIQHYAGRKKPWGPGRFKPVRERFIHYLHASRWFDTGDLIKFHAGWVFSTGRLALSELRKKFAPRGAGKP